MALRTRGLLLASLFLAFSASCSRPAPQAPSGAMSGESRELLGTSGDFAFTVRLDLLRADPVYAPLLTDAASKEDLEGVLRGVHSIDVVGTVDGPRPDQLSLWLAVRSAPNRGAIPNVWRKLMDLEHKGRQLRSGVFEFVSLTGDGWPFGIYFAPKDWVLLTGRAAGHGHDWFSTHTTAPPPLDFGEGTILGAWVGPEAMKSPLVSPKEPGSKGLVASSLRLRDGAHGDLLATGVYETSNDAEDAGRILRDRVGMYASIWQNMLQKCPGLGVLGLEHEVSGRTLSMRLTHLPEGLRAAMRCRFKE